MPSTCSSFSLGRYAVSSLLAFVVHGALAYALPTLSTTPRSDEDQTTGLMWLETTPLSGDADATKGADAQTQVAHALRAAPAERVRRRPKLGTHNRHAEAARDGHTPSEVVSTSEPFASPAAAPTVHGASKSGETLSDPADLPQSPTRGSLAGAQGDGPPSLLVASGAFGSAGHGGLVHGPILRAAAGGCPGYFPADARTKHGEVEIDVTVDAEGRASASSVLIEAPLGHGFGLAARGCVRTLRFAPAADRSGAAVAGHARLRLRFDRPVST